VNATATCPNGHVSGDPDWCDTCGAPMRGPGPEAQAQTPADPGGASASAGGIAPLPCPHCGALNAADNLFCESCGYDFTTGQAPEPLAPPPAAPGAPDGASAGDPVGATAAAPEPAAESGPAPWVVVVEVDAGWFALKGELADRPLPPPSTSTVPLRQHTSMVGRTSQSRAVRPEVALDTDTAVSRRHAQFVLEGDLLSVVDLASTNGTHVVKAGAVPDDDVVPLPSGVPTVLADGDQIFLGAWSRLTVRRT
jgi:hypothetical protein